MLYVAVASGSKLLRYTICRTWLRTRYRKVFIVFCFYEKNSRNSQRDMLHTAASACGVNLPYDRIILGVLA